MAVGCSNPGAAQLRGGRVAEAAIAVREELEKIETRPGTPADHPFLFGTWLRNYRASPFARRMRNDAYFALHHQAIDRILARGGRLVIAHPEGAPETILGYLVYEYVPDLRIAGVAVPEFIVQYLYVKKNFRGWGVARTLMESQGIVPGAVAFTHIAPDTEALWRKYPTASYWPHLLTLFLALASSLA
jgi:GNAT superfamily N-acetyltransferase